MQKLQYKKDINASAEIVYNAMLGLNNIETYEHWTAEFNATSTYDGNWEKGSKIYFIGTGEGGKREGMVSEIAENIPFKYVSIRHNGLLDGEKEITEGEEVEKWAGGRENYTFDEHDGITTVTAEVDVTDDFIEYFNETYPKALDRLKELVEK